LNDVLSLCVGLWAVKVANSKDSSAMYTYGVSIYIPFPKALDLTTLQWQRAETLGALVNGVFLVALCMSIFLEAIQRFVQPQIVTNPKLVMIVGILGLASNMLGLMLFHDHGHSHGDKEHDENSHDPLGAAEEGHGHTHSHSQEDSAPIGNERGNIADVLPQAVTGIWKPRSRSTAHKFSSSDESDTTATPTRATTLNSADPHTHRRRTSGSIARGYGSVDHIMSFPASFRQEIIAASRREERPDSDPEEEAITDESDPPTPNETSTLLKYADGSPRKSTSSRVHSADGHKRSKTNEHRHDSWHADHHHSQPRAEGKGAHGHSHGDLNMKGVFLHVMGDALGNIGVIGSALFIWLTKYTWRYYVDPAVSLVITIIILASAIPLCRAASRILLQAMPIHLDRDEIKADIEMLPGILSCHHIHIWQLSDTKIVASLHIQVDYELEATSSASYMHLVKQVRRCLHGFGIHSSTIQPEFHLKQADEDRTTTTSGSTVRGDGSASSPQAGPGLKTSRPGSLKSDSSACLLECGDECAKKNQCCPLPTPKK
jgi:solute carrier family 30 (zinc transporter), member 1